jgi:hypothetical protein
MMRDDDTNSVIYRFTCFTSTRVQILTPEVLPLLCPHETRHQQRNMHRHIFYILYFKALFRHIYEGSMKAL